MIDFPRNNGLLNLQKESVIDKIPNNKKAFIHKRYKNLRKKD